MPTAQVAATAEAAAASFELEHVLTAAELAERLRVHITSIYRAVGRGELRPLRIGGSLRFPVSEVERFTRLRLEGP